MCGNVGEAKRFWQETTTVAGADLHDDSPVRRNFITNDLGNYLYTTVQYLVISKQPDDTQIDSVSQMTTTVLQWKSCDGNVVFSESFQRENCCL